MSTTIKPVLSTKNPYYISKHRYYELKHFCLQYPEWRKELQALYLEPGSLKMNHHTDSKIGDRTAHLAMKRLILKRKMELVEQAAFATDPELADYILIAVTDGMSYEFLRMQKGIPCCREVFYDRYRKFFKVLSDSQK